MYPQSISTNYDNFVAVVVKDIRCGGLMSQGHTMSFKATMATHIYIFLKQIKHR